MRISSKTDLMEVGHLARERGFLIQSQRAPPESVKKKWVKLQAKLTGSLDPTIKHSWRFRDDHIQQTIGKWSFAQINWTIDDVLQIHEDWSEKEAENFLQEIEEELLDIMAEYGSTLIQHHGAGEKYGPAGD